MDRKQLRAIRILVALFMLGLVASGITAIPLKWELGLLDRWVGMSRFVRSVWPGLAEWIGLVRAGVQDGYGTYPFLAYGTDWLAFGHIAIAIAFIGALRDPLRNVWVIDFGMIACLLVIPWTLGFGSLRGIPQMWMLVDMSFGVFGILPLSLARRMVARVQAGP